MKKLIVIILICVAVVCLCVGCGEKGCEREKSVDRNTTKKYNGFK